MDGYEGLDDASRDRRTDAIGSTLKYVYDDLPGWSSEAERLAMLLEKFQAQLSVRTVN